MSVRYELSCECGKKHPVEISQAGQTVSCTCGATIKIPTMLAIKKLPLWEDAVESSAVAGKTNKTAKNKKSDDTPQTPNDEIDENAAKTRRSSAFSSPQRLGPTLVGGAIFVVAVFFCCRNCVPPNPIQVFYKQTLYSIDGKPIRRDSSPVDRADWNFYFYSDPVNEATYQITDQFIDYMLPIDAYLYFDSVKELDLSDNFNDNYESLKVRRTISAVVSGLVALVGLAIVLFGLFAPRSQKQVGAVRGSVWR